MRITLGSDHAGFRYKQLFAHALREAGHDVDDIGCDTDQTPSDYTEISETVARAVAEGRSERGIIVAGSGNGEAIVANKIHGVRASVCNDLYTAELARLHNDANVLCMGQRVMGEPVALKIVATWIDTAFEGGRHQPRLDNITALEERLRKEYSA